MNDKPTRPRDASSFKTLDSFLEEEGILVEVTQTARERVDALLCDSKGLYPDSEAHAILLEVVAAQNIQPYKGWDLVKLNTAYEKIENYIFPFSKSSEEPHLSLEKGILIGVLNARLTAPGKGWNISLLNKEIASARLLLGLPSVEELNPDIARMTKSLKAHVGNREFFQFKRQP